MLLLEELPSKKKKEEELPSDLLKRAFHPYHAKF